jgi:hypothetical protein
VRLDNEKPGQIGFPTPSNHQNLTGKPLRGEYSSNGRWDMDKVGVDLKVIWENPS